MTLLAFNKPFGVLCQFSRSGDAPTLADYVRVPAVYPAGRLDQDSEGLLLLTDDGQLQAAIAVPSTRLWKRYLAQVERIPEAAALERLSRGVMVGGRPTRPARVRVVAEPGWLWPRHPPIRFRKNVPTAWLEIEIHEGRNRQVRKMTAAIGHPTLRLVRIAIGPIMLAALAPGDFVELDPKLLTSALSRGSASPKPRRRPRPHTARRRF